jgi:hypothetical protein
MSFATLPWDLIDPILRYLQDDEETSRACSLVCHAWLCSARRNIFSNISLHFNVTKACRFLLLLHENLEVASFIRRITWTFSRRVYRRVENDSDVASVFFQCLSLLSDTQRVLHTIYINVQRDAEYMLELFEHAPQLYVCVDTVLWKYQNELNDSQKSTARSLALKLNRTKTLSIGQSDYNEWPLPVAVPTDDFASIFPAGHITKLYLSNTVFSSSVHYLRFLHAFSALEDLVCARSSLRTREIDGEAECCLLSTPPLRRIVFSDDSDLDEVTMKWLLAQSNPLQLETASFRCPMMASINDLLRRCAPTIQTLDIPGEPINVRYGATCLL